MTCLCCLEFPGFGDYFKFEKGGMLNGNVYGSGEEECTAAFLNPGTHTLYLPKDICDVQMLLVGGGGG